MSGVGRALTPVNAAVVLCSCGSSRIALRRGPATKHPTSAGDLFCLDVLAALLPFVPAKGPERMLGLEEVIAGAKVRGIAGPTAVDVVRVEWIGSDALNVVYRGADGPAEVLLFRDAEPRLELIRATRAL